MVEQSDNFKKNVNPKKVLETKERVQKVMKNIKSKKIVKRPRRTVTHVTRLNNRTKSISPNHQPNTGTINPNGEVSSHQEMALQEFNKINKTKSKSPNHQPNTGTINSNGEVSSHQEMALQEFNKIESFIEEGVDINVISLRNKKHGKKVADNTHVQRFTTHNAIPAGKNGEENYPAVTVETTVYQNHLSKKIFKETGK